MGRWSSAAARDVLGEAFGEDGAPLVLVADADEAVRRRTASFLASQGARVHTAATGNALLRELSGLLLGGPDAAPYELVVIGHRLGDTSGLEILTWLRRHDTGLPVVFLAPDEETRAEARRLGADVADHPPALAALVQPLRGIGLWSTAPQR